MPLGIGEYAPHAFRYISEPVMISMVGSAILSLILLSIIAVRLVSHLIRESKITFQVKFYAIGHLICDIMFCLFAGFIRTDLIFPIKYNLSQTSNPDPFICSITIFPAFVFYYLSKMFLYLFFIQRIDTSFHGSVYECNAKFLKLCQFTVMTMILLSTFVFCVFGEFQFCETKDNSIHVCSAYTGNLLRNYSGFAIVSMSAFDLLFSSMFLGIFVYKLKVLAKQSMLVHGMDRNRDRDKEIDGNGDGLGSAAMYQYHRLEDSANQSKLAIKRNPQLKTRLNKWIAITLKCCVLTSVAIISNWVFLFIGGAFVFDLGWFICIDCLINGFCVFLIFKFNHGWYSVFCWPVIRSWKIVAQFCGITKRSIRRMKSVELSMSRSRKARIKILKPTKPTL